MSVLEHLADIAPDRVRLLRRTEYERMAAQGLFEGERVELLDGVVVEMSPQEPRHAAAVQRLTRVLGQALAGRADVRVQLPLAVPGESLPEPDLAVVAIADFDEAHPTTAFLVVEVADTSLRKDRSVKRTFYARAGIPEYWVVNLVDHVIEIHTLIVDASYTRITEAGTGATIHLQAFPETAIAASDIIR